MHTIIIYFVAHTVRLWSPKLQDNDLIALCPQWRPQAGGGASEEANAAHGESYRGGLS